MHFYRRLRPIQAFSFDLDDTLYDNAKVIRHTEKTLLLWLAEQFPVTRHVKPAQWLALKHRIAVDNPGLSDNLTQWRRETIATMLMQLGVRGEKVLEATDAGMNVVLKARHQIDVPHETHQVLNQLKHYFPLVAITNGNVDVNRIGLGEYFEFSLQGGVEGAAKPASDLFEIAAQRLSLPVEGILHIGDHLESDVLGAKQAGAMAAWINLHHGRIGRHNACRQLPDLEITALSQLLMLLPRDV